MLTPAEVRTLSLLSRDPEFKTLLDALVSSHPSPDRGIRFTQATRLCESGMAKALGYDEGQFGELLAAIPEVPADLELGERPFLRYHGPKLSELGLKVVCAIVDVDYGGDDSTLVPFDAESDLPIGFSWIVLRDGRENHNKKPVDCRTEFAAAGRVSCDVWDGLLAYIQDKTVIEEGVHIMDLPGSVFRAHRGSYAYLRVFRGRAELRWFWDDYANPRYGSASRRKCRP